MTNPDPVSEILRLSVAERVQAAQDIWDSIAADADALAITPDLRDELDRRLADQEANPGVGTPWSEVKRLVSLRCSAVLGSRKRSSQSG